MDILGCQTLSKSLLDEIDCKRLDVLADSRQINILVDDTYVPRPRFVKM